MSHQGLLTAGLCGVLAAGVGVDLCLRAAWSPGSAPAHTWSSSAWQGPPGASAEQHRALAEHILQGAPLPPGFTQLEETTIHLTGAVDPSTKRREIEVELTGDPANLEQARLYVDGALQATATRGNGGIADRPLDGTSIATLRGWVSRSGESWSASVQWDGGPGGPPGESTLRIKEPWFKGWLARILDR